MKIILIFACLACIVISQNIQQCESGCKHKKCTLQEAPVCGIQVAAGNVHIKTTYANHCIACSGGIVNFTVEGKCQDYPDDIQFCSPQESNAEVCTDEYDPHCGWSNSGIVCITYPCGASDASNRCEACKTPGVVYTTKGPCPRP